MLRMSSGDVEYANGLKCSNPSNGFLGMFKSKPDWDLAAHHFDQAGKLKSEVILFHSIFKTDSYLYSVILDC